MIKLIYIITLLSIFLIEINGQICTDPITGDGSEGDPFLIYNATQLEKIDSLGLDKYYKLMCHIDYDLEGITHIQEGIFTGQLDGNFYEIRNLTMTQVTGTYAGFFERVQIGGNIKGIKDLTIRNWILNKTGTVTNVGLLGGVIGGLTDIWNVHVRQCSVIVTGNGTSDAAFMFGKAVGDQIDFEWCSIDSSYIEHSDLATASSGTFMGGFISDLGGDVDIDYCYVANTHFHNGISGVTFQQTGGFVGLGHTSGYIRDSYAKNLTYSSNRTNGTWGAFAPTSMGALQRCYMIGQTDISPTITTQNYTANSSTGDSHEGSYFDTTGTTFSDWTVTATAGNIRNTAQMLDSTNYVDRALGTWFEVVADTNADGTQIWYIDALINDGYPYLYYAGVDTTRLPNPPPEGYFHLVDLRSDLTIPAGQNQTVPIGWEANTTQFIEFDSITTLYQRDKSNIDRIIDSTVIIGDSAYVIARGLEYVATFDSIFSRPSPVDIISHITGSGTLIDPYVLYNARDVDSTRIWLGEDIYYALGADIDMSIYGNWSNWLVSRWNRNRYEVPNFGAGLDGRGYTIKNLDMTVPQGGGPTTFITLNDHYDTLNQHVKNIVFDSCNIVVTGNPYAQISQNVFIYKDQFELGIYQTTIAFIEAKGDIENIIFTNCSINVNVDTLWSYSNIGYIYKPNNLGVDSLYRVGLESSDLLVDIDAMKLYQQYDYKSYHIAMISPTDNFNGGGACWIDSACIMTIDIGAMVDKDTTDASKTVKLYMGSIASGNGGTMYDTYADGIYSWTVDASWDNRIDTTVYRHGYYGLLSGILPSGNTYTSIKNYMRRNLFIGKMTTNIDTVLGVTYNSTGSGLFRMGSSYYNSDSVGAFVPSSFKVYSGNILLGIASDSNGIPTDSLKVDTVYKYGVYTERLVELPSSNQWGFIFDNWRIDSLINRGYPHIYGQNNYPDTAYTAVLSDTAGVDTLVYLVVPSSCGITRIIDIDTVSYFNDIIVPINRIDITIRTYNLDSIDIYYAYADEVDTNYTYLGRSKVSQVMTLWDTTTFSYDITTTGIDATRPILFKASVLGILPTLDEYKDGDIETSSVISDQQRCQQFSMLVQNGSIVWRRIKDVTCGWVSGATVTKSEGNFTGTYIDNLLSTNITGASASGLSLNFNTECRPLGHRGYDLSWDKWLCDLLETDTIITQIEYTQCDYLFRYYIAAVDDIEWLFFYNDFDDSTRALIDLGQSSSLWTMSIGSQVGSIGELSRFGNMAIFKLAKLSASADPADDIYAYGTSEGVGPAQPLGNILASKFRGIHPKIWKWGRQDGTRPDSIYIMTPDGPIKVKL